MANTVPGKVDILDKWSVKLSEVNKRNDYSIAPPSRYRQMGLLAK
jgi:hypothetical protein